MLLTHARGSMMRGFLLALIVLVLSCGVIASPDRPRNTVPLLNLETITGQAAGRADALLFVQFKGTADKNIPVGSRVVSPAASFNRGRY